MARNQQINCSTLFPYPSICCSERQKLHAVFLETPYKTSIWLLQTCGQLSNASLRTGSPSFSDSFFFLFLPWFHKKALSWKLLSYALFSREPRVKQWQHLIPFLTFSYLTLCLCDYFPLPTSMSHGPLLQHTQNIKFGTCFSTFYLVH